MFCLYVVEVVSHKLYHPGMRVFRDINFRFKIVQMGMADISVLFLPFFPDFAYKSCLRPIGRKYYSPKSLSMNVF